MCKDKCVTKIPRISKNNVRYLGDDKLSQLAKFTSSLSDPIRLQILYLLQQQEDICTCEFQELLNLSQSKISYHLRILMDAGIIQRKVYGNWSHYNLIKKDILTQIELL